MDLKDYKMAFEYFKMELDYHTDPSEECRAILNIAYALEEMNAPYAELERLYQKAQQIADEAGNPRLKADSLNSLAVLQKRTPGYQDQFCMISIDLYILWLKLIPIPMTLQMRR